MQHLALCHLSAPPRLRGQGALRAQQPGVGSAHALRRSREPIEVKRAASSIFESPRSEPTLAVRLQGLSQFTRFVCSVGAPASLSAVPSNRAGTIFALGVQRRRTNSPTPSNTSLNRTANGLAPSPRSALVHHAPHGQGTTPSSAG